MTSMGMQTREKKKNFLVAEEISALREIMPLIKYYFCHSENYLDVADFAVFT